MVAPRKRLVQRVLDELRRRGRPPDQAVLELSTTAPRRRKRRKPKP